MQFFAKLSALLILCSSTALAATESGGEFAKKLASAAKWDHLLKTVQPHLNPLVFKELSVLTNDLPFPTMRVRQDKLMISNENGEHVTIVLFKKNGAVTFNGKEWKLNPLATPAAEVERISRIFEQKYHTSFLDFVVTPAHAAGGMTAGVAAAAYAGSAAWKGQACKEADISKELRGECAVMAVAMQPMPFDSSVAPVSKDYYPIEMSCPNRGTGTLSVVYKLMSGAAIKTEVTYQNSAYSEISVATAEPSSSFSNVLRGKIEDQSTQRLKDIAQATKNQSDALLRNVCFASKPEFDRHMSMVAENKRMFRSSSASDVIPSQERGRTSTGL